MPFEMSISWRGVVTVSHVHLLLVLLQKDSFRRALSCQEASSNWRYLIHVASMSMKRWRRGYVTKENEQRNELCCNTLRLNTWIAKNICMTGVLNILSVFPSLIHWLFGNFNEVHNQIAFVSVAWYRFQSLFLGLLVKVYLVLVLVWIFSIKADSRPPPPTKPNTGMRGDVILSRNMLLWLVQGQHTKKNI